MRLRASYASLDEAVTAVDKRTERPFRCHVHDDSRASASVNVHTGWWYCYTCHAKGKTDETLLYRDCESIALDVLEMLDSPTSVGMSERMLDLYTSQLSEYWLSRFDRETVQHFQLGTDYASERPCYPMRSPDGELLGIVKRNLDPDGPKYRYPTNVVKSELLFNYSYDHHKMVVLTEGAPDAMAAWEVGYTAFGIYGSRLSVAQSRLIEKVSPTLVVLAFNNDKAGREATEYARKSLPCFVNSVDWTMFPDDNDLGDLSKVNRKLLLDSVAL